MGTTNRLGELRLARGLSRRELAAQIVPQKNGMHVSERTIVRWERGETRIPEDRIAEFATFFGVSRSFLLGGAK